MMRARVMNGVEVKSATRPAKLTGNVANRPPNGPAATRRLTSARTSTAWEQPSTRSWPAGPRSRGRPWSRPWPGSSGGPDPSQTIPGRDPRRVPGCRGEDAGQGPRTSLPDPRGGGSRARARGEGTSHGLGPEQVGVHPALQPARIDGRRTRRRRRGSTTDRLGPLSPKSPGARYWGYLTSVVVALARIKLWPQSDHPLRADPDCPPEPRLLMARPSAWSRFTSPGYCMNSVCSPRR